VQGGGDETELAVTEEAAESLEMRESVADMRKMLVALGDCITTYSEGGTATELAAVLRRAGRTALALARFLNKAGKPRGRDRGALHDKERGGGQHEGGRERARAASHCSELAQRLARARTLRIQSICAEKTSYPVGGEGLTSTRPPSTPSCPTCRRGRVLRQPDCALCVLPHLDGGSFARVGGRAIAERGDVTEAVHMSPAPDDELRPATCSTSQPTFSHLFKCSTRPGRTQVCQFRLTCLPPTRSDSDARRSSCLFVVRMARHVVRAMCVLDRAASSCW